MYKYLFKYIIVGDTGVGKSSIMQRFINNEFLNQYEVTVGVEFGTKILEINNELIRFQIWDTTGQEQFKSITRTYYRSAIGAFLVFDLSRQQTFDHIKQWMSDIEQYGSENVNIVLIGNKSDLKREVDQQQIQDFIDKRNIMYFETSAKQNTNIEQVFVKSAEQILEKINSGEIIVDQNTNGIKINQTYQQQNSQKNACCQN